MIKTAIHLLFLLSIFSSSSVISQNRNILTKETIDQYPNIPLLEIYTQNREEPTCKTVLPPKGCWGQSITDNNYVSGNMKLWIDGEEAYSSGTWEEETYGMKIKIRGNSTGAILSQHPYKIKLKNPVDLFMPADSSHSDKEWILLAIGVWNTRFTNSSCDILPFIGSSVSEAVGCKWTPRYQFVNLVMNGSYRGCYVLADAISRSNNRINIKKTGFILENDAYWWNEGDNYFKTTYIDDHMGYTFKYPDTDDITDSIKNIYKEYLNAIEEKIFCGDDVSNLISYSSFSKWILVHDILGSTDAGGSNIFLYKKDFENNNYSSSLLKMGPTWDYDSSFKAQDSSPSAIHSSSVFYYAQLFKNPLFETCYNEICTNVIDNIYEYAAHHFDSIYSSQGEAINESLKLSHNLYGQSINDLKLQGEECLSYLRQRTVSLRATNLEYFSLPTKGEKVKYYNLFGIPVIAKPHGIYIHDGKIIQR